jgi:hypothetical protein
MESLLEMESVSPKGLRRMTVETLPHPALRLLHTGLSEPDVSNVSNSAVRESISRLENA